MNIRNIVEVLVWMWYSFQEPDSKAFNKESSESEIVYPALIIEDQEIIERKENDNL